MPPHNFSRLGVPMIKESPMLPMDYLMNQQRMQPQQSGFGMNEVNAIQGILGMLNNNSGSTPLNTDFSTSQNMGLLSSLMPSLNSNNIGSMIGDPLNRTFATPGLLYTMNM